MPPRCGRSKAATHTTVPATRCGCVALVQLLAEQRRAQHDHQKSEDGERAGTHHSNDPVNDRPVPTCCAHRPPPPRMDDATDEARICDL